HARSKNVRARSTWFAFAAARPKRSSSKGSVDEPSRTRTSSTFAGEEPFGAALPVVTRIPGAVEDAGLLVCAPAESDKKTEAASAARNAFIRPIVRGSASRRPAELFSESAPVEDAHRPAEKSEDARVVWKGEFPREKAIHGRQKETPGRNRLDAGPLPQAFIPVADAEPAGPPSPEGRLHDEIVDENVVHDRLARPQAAREGFGLDLRSENL